MQDLNQIPFTFLTLHMTRYVALVTHSQAQEESADLFAVTVREKLRYGLTVNIVKCAK